VIGRCLNQTVTAHRVSNRTDITQIQRYNKLSDVTPELPPREWRLAAAPAVAAEIQCDYAITVEMPDNLIPAPAMKTSRVNK